MIWQILFEQWKAKFKPPKPMTLQWLTDNPDARWQIRTILYYRRIGF